MSKIVEKIKYKFSDIVLTGHVADGRPRIIWYLECPQCHGKHMFRRDGPRIWHAQCILAGIEWTITPREYHISKKCDLRTVMGEE